MQFARMQEEGLVIQPELLLVDGEERHGRLKDVEGWA
jgi:hypothetical protein